MTLKTNYTAIDEIPEPHRDLYTERNGQFELTGVEGIKTQGDIDRLTVALNKERADHKAAREASQPWAPIASLGLSPEDALAKLDRFEELEAAAAGKIDETKLDEMVNGRLKTQLAPVTRERDQFKTENEQLKEQLGKYAAAERQRNIHDNVRKALVEHKVIAEAQEDVLFLAERVFEVREDDGEVVTRDGVGVTPGIRAADWLLEMQPKRPHWWPASQGGGAGGNAGGGGAGSNPWTAGNWSVTKQMQFAKEHGPEKAASAAKAAGSFIGSTTPPAK